MVKLREDFFDIGKPLSMAGMAFMQAQEANFREKGFGGDQNHHLIHVAKNHAVIVLLGKTHEIQPGVFEGSMLKIHKIETSRQNTIRIDVSPARYVPGSDTFLPLGAASTVDVIEHRGLKPIIAEFLVREWLKENAPAPKPSADKTPLTEVAVKSLKNAAASTAVFFCPAIRCDQPSVR